MDHTAAQVSGRCCHGAGVCGRARSGDRGVLQARRVTQYCAWPNPLSTPYVHIWGAARSFARGPRHTSSWALHSFNLNVTVGGEPWGVCKPGALGPGGEARGA